MTIAELAGKGKEFLDRIPSHSFVAVAIVLSASAAFGLGFLEGKSTERGSGVTITELATTTPGFLEDASPAAVADAPLTPASTTIPAGGEVVASKNGAKYYLPWCGGAKLIKDENKIWFPTKEAAEAAGYEPAANCKGL